MSNATELFRRYVQERRTSPIPGFVCERLPGLTRYVPTQPEFEGIILFATLSGDEADAVIENQIALFRGLQRGFEWKIHTLDRPADLADRLSRRGFTAGEVEALMLYWVSEFTPSRRVSPVDIRPIRRPDEIEALVALQEEVWGRSLPWLGPALNGALERLALFGAYDRNRLVGTGWIDFPPGSSIADLHGGAVLPAYRGKGIYSALFEARVEVARARGFEQIAVDAAPLSRPILLRKGFQFICETTPFLYPPDHADAPRAIPTRAESNPRKPVAREK